MRIKISNKLVYYLFVIGLIYLAFIVGQIVGIYMTYQAFMCGSISQPLVNPNFNLWKC